MEGGTIAAPADDFRVLHSVRSGAFEASILERDWPAVVDYTASQATLAVEMSLPPYMACATASFPEIAPDDNCFMGRMFIRYPGRLVRGRGPGGRIRLLRCDLGEEASREILARLPEPDLDTLKALLDIRVSALRSILDLVHHEMLFGREQSAAALSALGKLVAVEVGRLFEHHSEATAQPGKLPDRHFRKVREMIARHGGRVGAGELAAACGMSVRHLQRQFSKLTGDTLTGYMQRAWLEQAQDLLAAGDLPVAEISQRSDFANTASFSRAFRRATGLTPSQFRQAARHA